MSTTKLKSRRAQDAARGMAVRIDARLWERIQAFHLAPGKRVESLSLAWGRCDLVDGEWLLLMPDQTPWMPFGPDCLEVAAPGQVRLRPDVLNGVLVQFASSCFNCLVNIHDHWFADDAHFSPVDDEDDLCFERYLRTRFEPMLARRPEIGPQRTIHHASIVIGRAAVNARITNSLQDTAFSPLRRMIALDTRHRALPVGRAPGKSRRTAETLVRHEAFMPSKVQTALATWHVALAGCGGLGSIMAETLLRLGVRQFTLIDGDQLDASNLNRWQGAGPADVGQLKVEVLARHLRTMAPGVQVRALAHPLEHETSVQALAGADAIVSLIDNDVGRYFLAHLSLQYLVPLFDLGVLIRTDPGVDFDLRFFAVIPGLTGCTMCKRPFRLLQPDAVMRHYADPATVRARVAAGYLQERPDVSTPSAYALNQRVVALAGLELANHFAAWRPLATLLHESWRTGRVERIDKSNFDDRSWDDCPLCSLRLGQGAGIPLPCPPVAGRSLLAESCDAFTHAER